MAILFIVVLSSIGLLQKCDLHFVTYCSTCLMSISWKYLGSFRSAMYKDTYKVVLEARCRKYICKPYVRADNDDNWTKCSGPLSNLVPTILDINMKKLFVLHFCSTRKSLLEHGLST